MLDFYFYMEMSYQMECKFFVVVMTFKANIQNKQTEDTALLKVTIFKGC